MLINHLFNFFQYEMEALAEQCLDHLLNTMNEELVCEALLIADMHNCAVLKDHCLTYIRGHKTKARATDGWKQLEANHADLVNLVNAKKSRNAKK